jgi:hypothetical protein
MASAKVLLVVGGGSECRYIEMVLPLSPWFVFLISTSAELSKPTSIRT